MSANQSVLIAGGTGLIGRAFIEAYQSVYDITVLGRNQQVLHQYFPHLTGLSWDALNDVSPDKFDAVINLCGENISNKRWTSCVKQSLLDSRVQTTRRLVEWINTASHAIHLYQASAVGFCGATALSSMCYTDDVSYQYPAQPTDFLQLIAKAWESEVNALNPMHQVTIMRFGVVLKEKEGFLGKLRLSFLMGLGSVMGEGKQSLSWVHYQDLIRAMDFLLTHPNLTGVIHLTSPNPVSQKDFAMWYADFLHRPLWLTTPAWLIRCLFGEMGEVLINQGCAVGSKRLQEAGFSFSYPQLNTLKDL